MMGALVVIMAGCSSSNQPQSPDKSDGRVETKTLEGASVVGYDGKAIRKSVDNTLDKTDDHTKNLDKELSSGADGQQKP